ncbi:MAG: TetR/AcrR family transcriptional regulator [Deltaproteobacteria bacterium]|nr:TetR/AcrR family transcriptional regulator [Deltaproteobacteria bacterium]
MNGSNKDDVRSPGRPRNPVSRDHLLEVARGAFAQSGYAGTSMGDIADAVGLRKSSLFHHFDSKNRLYREVILGMVSDLDGLVEQLAAREGTYPERLAALCEYVVDYLGSHPWAALLVLRESMDEHIFVQEEGRELLDRTLNRFAAFLKAGMDAGAFAQDNPHMLALSIVGVHFLHFAASGVSARLLGEDVFTPDSLAEWKRLVAQRVSRMVTG